VDILLISPERLANEHFRTEVLARFAGRISLLVIDEAHCISDWGHDFRPHYRLLERIVRTLPPNLRLLATTATANNRVLDDLQTVLGPHLTVSRGDLARPSLFLQSIRLPSQAERLAWLAQQLPTLQGSGIIYTLTVRDATQVAKWLRSRGLNVQSYTGETGERRPQLEQDLLNNQVKALVATTALGMGFDKPNLAFVIHFQTPSSVVAYYQQVGRAGRALESAYGVLLSGQEEAEINDYFIESAFPLPHRSGTGTGGITHSTGWAFNQRIDGEGQCELGTTQQGGAVNVARIARSHRQTRQQMDADHDNFGQFFLATGRAADSVASRRTGTNAAIRCLAFRPHGIPRPGIGW
jgi:ATP-dependent DNA helicase RecQ